MKSVHLILLFASFILPICTIKFGFILYDEGNVFNDKFVAFGSFPASITPEQMAAVSHDLNKLYRYQRIEMKKRSEVESPSKFQVNLFQQSILADGGYQVALTGELSGFLAQIRFVMFNALKRNEIWKEAKFYWDPVVKMTHEAFKRAPTTMHVTLVRAAFDNHDFAPNDHLSLIEPAKSFADIIPQYVEEDDYDDAVEDENRFTILEFFSSTGSIQDPMAESSPKNSIRSKLFNRRKGPSKCFKKCTIS